MNHATFNFSTQDGLSLLGRIWKTPQQQPKGTVNLVHGIGEHSGRYAHIAEALGEAGYHLASFDLRGHGLSEGKQGHTPSFDHLLDDVQLFLESTRERLSPNLPNFLYGHSLGANIVINYCLRRPTELTGVIATAPSFALAFEPPAIKLLLGKIMAAIMPSFTMNNALELDDLARDKAVVKAYKDDPFVHDRLSARLAMDILESGRYALEHAQEWRLPLLLMHGTADGIGSHQASRDFSQKANSQVELILWDGYYHEIHNDIGKEKVIEKLLVWLDEKAPLK